MDHFTPAPDMERLKSCIQRDLAFMALISFLAVCAALPAAFLVAGGGM